MNIYNEHRFNGVLLTANVSKSWCRSLLFASGCGINQSVGKTENLWNGTVRFVSSITVTYTKRLRKIAITHRGHRKRLSITVITHRGHRKRLCVTVTIHRGHRK